MPGTEASFLPARVDLRETACFPLPVPPNQGDDVSCVTQALAAAVYCAQIDGTEASKSGLPLHPNVKEVHSAALLESWDKTKGISFGSAVNAMQKTQPNLRFQTVSNDIFSIKTLLARHRVPLVVGYQVNQLIYNFHTDAEIRRRHGTLLPPYEEDFSDHAGHAVLIVGYDDSVGCFIARNSWGTGWGEKGHFLIRYRDMADVNFFTDLVVCTTVVAPADVGH